MLKAFSVFGLPQSAISINDFIDNVEMDVFTFGRSPVSIDIMTRVKGLDFDTAYLKSEWYEMSVDFKVRLIYLTDLIRAKRSANRHKDLDDIEHLLQEE